MTNREAIHKLIGYRRFIEKMAMTIPGYIFDAEPFDLAISALEKQEQVVPGYWILQKENHEFKEAWMKCSTCGYPVSRWTGNTNFCPNCGAKMDAQGEE